VATDEPTLDSVENHAEGVVDLPVNMAVHCPVLLIVPLRTPGLMVLGYSVLFAWVLEVR
jgi:hypothetical protein